MPRIQAAVNKRMSTEERMLQVTREPMPDPGPFHSALELLIVQPTPFCNINCDYCYLPNRTNRTVMQEQVFAAAFDSVVPYLGDHLTIVWHGGEPLAAPLGFYHFAFEKVRAVSQAIGRVDFCFQTNGTLITEEWCEFFLSTGSKVGVSLDGPAIIHNQQRRLRSGAGTHESTMRGVELLKKYNIPFYVISVITNESLSHAHAIYEFIKATGCTSWAFNIEDLDGDNLRRSFADQSLDGLLRKFISDLFSLWLSDPRKIHVREFDGLMAAIIQGVEGSGQETTPLAIINVNSAGFFSTFSPELMGLETHHGKFVFGNVLTDEIAVMFSNERYQAIQEEITAGIEKCRSTCVYFGVCGGGAPANKFFEHKRFDVSETRSCKTQKKIVIDEVLAILETRLGSIAKEVSNAY